MERSWKDLGNDTTIHMKRCRGLRYDLATTDRSYAPSTLEKYFCARKSNQPANNRAGVHIACVDA